MQIQSWQQTLNQPLVTASWNDLKTCVTFWPNLGWCSTSLTRTEARTALMTSDFHYKPAVDPGEHSGWDRGWTGQLHHLGRNMLVLLGSCEQWCSHRCSLLICCWNAAAALSSLSPLLTNISYLRAAFASIRHGFPWLSSSCHGAEECDTVTALRKPCITTVCWVCWSVFESLVCMWFERTVDVDLGSCTLNPLFVTWPHIDVDWSRQGCESSLSVLTSWREA